MSAEIQQSDGPLDPISMHNLIARGVRDATGWMRASGGLFYTKAAKNEQWLAVARQVFALEQALHVHLDEARSELEKVRNDDWTQVSVGWEDVLE